VFAFQITWQRAGSTSTCATLKDTRTPALLLLTVVIVAVVIVVVVLVLVVVQHIRTEVLVVLHIIETIVIVIQSGALDPGKEVVSSNISIVVRIHIYLIFMVVVYMYICTDSLRRGWRTGSCAVGPWMLIYRCITTGGRCAQT
jgi:carbon starvation protein CstA